MSPASQTGKTGPYPLPDPRAAFVLALGRALHGAGEPTNRAEELLEDVADRLGLTAQFLITPTSIIAAFGPEDRQRTHVIRTEPATTNLGKLAQLDRVVVKVLRGELTAEKALSALNEATAPAPIQPAIALLGGYALASACSARVLGGGWREIITAGGIGAVIGVIASLASTRTTLQRLFEPVAAFLAAVLLALAAKATGGMSATVSTLASLIVLMPGMALTNAMTELTTRHLAAGTARLMQAFMVFLAMGFGVALGSRLVHETLGAVPVAEPRPLAAWTIWPAVVLVAVSFSVLLSAARRDFGWILLACLVGFTSSRSAASLLGPELGMFVGAFAVGILATIVARRADQPTALIEVPGTLVLVPGSIGFRSITALLENQVVSGLETAFRVLLIAMSLVAGLLMANLVMPRPRRP
ncbi:MAG TPA: threonine/serine exporter family protein [Gemmatimonadales bacterium]|nr:threonine/serine exporter family protein [Gemmatimonadales bacterium]